MAKLKERVETLQEYLILESRTTMLWVQYMNYTDVIKMFILAERTGNWDAATAKMLNLCAAKGHFNYAKSTRLHLQTMFRLEYDSPWLHRQFKENGFHCVRRSDKYWAGLWADLTMEQTMMRSIKSLSELTRGRGMNEGLRNLWIRTLHSCSEAEQAMRNVTLTKKQTSEQHVELGTS